MKKRTLFVIVMSSIILIGIYQDNNSYYFLGSLFGVLMILLINPFRITSFLSRFINFS